MVRPEKIVSGTFGELWIDEYYCGEVTSLEASVTLDKQEVNQCGSLAKSYKTVGFDCKGTVKLNKVNSFFLNLMSENMKEGKSTVCTIISSVKDPDNGGTEKIKLENCSFDTLQLANWETKKLGEESYAFTFDSWEIMESIDA